MIRQYGPIPVATPNTQFRAYASYSMRRCVWSAWNGKMAVSTLEAENPDGAIDFAAAQRPTLEK